MKQNEDAAPSILDDVWRDAMRYRFVRVADGVRISHEAARDPVVWSTTRRLTAPAHLRTVVDRGSPCFPVKKRLIVACGTPLRSSSAYAFSSRGAIRAFSRDRMSMNGRYDDA